jgi:hypothetical protein
MENQIIYNLKKSNKNNNNNYYGENNNKKKEEHNNLHTEYNNNNNKKKEEYNNLHTEYNNNNNKKKEEHNNLHTEIIIENKQILSNNIRHFQNRNSVSVIMPSLNINERVQTPTNVFENNNKQRYHYFIGNIFRNDHQIKLLKRIQSKLRKKYLLRKFHWSNYFCTNLIYLGYLDQATATKYMENIIKKLLSAISNKFSKLICNYNNYKISYDKSYYKVSLEINDTNNYLKDIIIPYLEENGIKPIYEKKTFPHNPSIDLIYYKYSDYFKDRKPEIRIQIPEEQFIIDHISLIKGTPVSIRSGTPSLHDQMHLEEILKYKFPLKEI